VKLARALLLWGLVLATACSGSRDILARGQRYYEDNQYERALAIWRELARYEDALSETDGARYAYLRGMTDYRLGFRDDARHWLALAQATEQRHPGGLDLQWLARLDGALEDLDRDVFGIRANGSDPVQSIEAPATEGSDLNVPPAEDAASQNGPAGSPPTPPALPRAR
jgi:tetratricopeptide (TPR) repeat protein